MGTRTTLITFTLVPRRVRVLAAKVFAGVVLASIALVIASARGAGAAIAQPDVNGAWSISPEFFGQLTLYVTASMLMGVGFGPLLSSPVAIVLYFLMPIGAIAVSAIPWFDGVVPWLDWWSSVSILADQPLTRPSGHAQAPHCRMGAPSPGRRALAHRPERGADHAGSVPGSTDPLAGATVEVWNLADRLPSPPTLLRIGLVVFVLAWLFGPYELQSAIPIWLPFLIALGLEIHFFVGAFARLPRSAGIAGRRPATGSATATTPRSFSSVTDRELWIPYSGETEEELQELLDDARELPEEEPEPAVVADREPERRLPVRRFLVGLGLIGALALTFWFVESRTGWNGLDSSTRAEATALPPRRPHASLESR